MEFPFIFYCFVHFDHKKAFATCYGRSKSHFDGDIYSSVYIFFFSLVFSLFFYICAILSVCAFFDATLPDFILVHYHDNMIIITSVILFSSTYLQLPTVIFPDDSKKNTYDIVHYQPRVDVVSRVGASREIVMELVKYI